MLNSTELDLIYAILMDASENQRNQNNIHTSNIYANLADRFADEYSTDDSELEYQDMLNCQEKENDLIETIATEDYNDLQIIIFNKLWSLGWYDRIQDLGAGVFRICVNNHAYLMTFCPTISGKVDIIIDEVATGKGIKCSFIVEEFQALKKEQLAKLVRKCIDLDVNV